MRLADSSMKSTVAAALGTEHSVSLGTFHALVLDRFGGVWALGSDYYWQKGQGRVREEGNLHDETTGRDANDGCVSSRDSEVDRWAEDTPKGELDTVEDCQDRDLDARRAPHRVSLPHKAEQVYAIRYSSYAIDERGVLWAWGENHDCDEAQPSTRLAGGLLGLARHDGSAPAYVARPCAVPGPRRATKLVRAVIRGGVEVLYVLDSDGRVWWDAPVLNHESGLRLAPLPCAMVALVEGCIAQGVDGQWYLLQGPSAVRLDLGQSRPGVPLVGVSGFSGFPRAAYGAFVDASGGLWRWCTPGAALVPGHPCAPRQGSCERMPLGVRVVSLSLDGDDLWVVDTKGRVWLLSWLSRPHPTIGVDAASGEADVGRLVAPCVLSRPEGLPPLCTITAGHGLVYGLGQDGSLWFWDDTRPTTGPSGAAPVRLGVKHDWLVFRGGRFARVGVDLDHQVWFDLTHAGMGFVVHGLGPKEGLQDRLEPMLSCWRSTASCDVAALWDQPCQGNPDPPALARAHRRERPAGEEPPPKRRRLDPSPCL